LIRARVELPIAQGDLLEFKGDAVRTFFDLELKPLWEGQFGSGQAEGRSWDRPGAKEGAIED
jgi:hypothetical protein